LAVFLALEAAETVGSGEGVGGWVLVAPRGVWAMLGGATLVAWSLLRAVNKWAAGRVSRAEGFLGQGLRLPGRVELLGRGLILGVYAAELTAGGWARQVEGQWQLGRYVLADELALLAPFAVLALVHWHCHYPVNRRVREYVVAGQLAEGLAARPVWGRRQYMAFQARGSLGVVLAPLLLILGVRDAVEQVAAGLGGAGAGSAWAVEGATAAGAGVVFVLAPVLLKRIWQTRPLPAGPLRERLEGLCRRIGLRCREILLWETYSAVANAAVMGLVRPVRYVLLSDALIENVADEQIDAVFGHEAGHVRGHHILFLGLFVAGASLLAAVLSELVWRGAGAMVESADKAGMVQDPAGWERWREWLMYGWLGVLLTVGAGLFGWVSRRFERQADVYAAKMVEAEWAGGQEGSGPGVSDPLGPHGAYVVGATLIRVALLNGVSAEARSWRHSSVAGRVSFLRRLSEKEGELAGFERVVRRLKSAIVAGLAAGAAGLGALYWWGRGG